MEFTLEACGDQVMEQITVWMGHAIVAVGNP